MKQNNAEVLKNTGLENNLKEMLSNSRMSVREEEMEAREAEDDVRSLELELMQAQAAHEAKEEAERKGKETSEKIQEIVG
jgi:hypothetical protein